MKDIGLISRPIHAPNHELEDTDNNTTPTRYNRVQRNQFDAEHFLSIFHQPLHVSGVSRPIIRRYNRMYKTFGTYYSF